MLKSFKNVSLFKVPVHKPLQIIVFMAYLVLTVASNYTSYISMSNLLFNIGKTLAILIIVTVFQAVFLFGVVKYLLKTNWQEALRATLQMSSLSFVMFLAPIALYQAFGVAQFLNNFNDGVYSALRLPQVLDEMMLYLASLGVVLYVGMATLLSAWVLQQYCRENTKLGYSRTILSLAAIYGIIALMGLGLSMLQRVDDFSNIKIDKNDTNLHSPAYTAIYQALIDNIGQTQTERVIMFFLLTKPRSGGLTPNELQELIKIAEQQKKQYVVDRLKGFGKMAVELKQHELEIANKLL